MVVENAEEPADDARAGVREAAAAEAVPAATGGGTGGGDRCWICNDVITIAIYKGTGVCCDNHRKARARGLPS